MRETLNEHRAMRKIFPKPGPLAALWCAIFHRRHHLTRDHGLLGHCSACERVCWR